MEKMKLHTPDFTDEYIAKLAKLFPNCVTETRDDSGNLKKAIDFDQLQQELSTSIVHGQQERYQLNWPGKQEALLVANTPIAKTLRPCREDSEDFDMTKNLFIEGDNLDALKLLQETYLNKVKMIYIDPPYNTGKDFIYQDNFSESAKDYLQNSNQEDEEGNRLVLNTNTYGRFHSDWLTMMYSRLKLARNLLKDDGVIFISIDDNEVFNLQKLCNEIFGEENFIGLFIINSSPSAIDYGHIAKTHDYALFYAKDIDTTETHHLQEKDKVFKYTDNVGRFNLYPLYNGNVAFNPSTRPNLYYPFYLNHDNKLTDINLNSNNELTDEFYEIGLEKRKGWIEVYPVVSKKDGIQRVWRWGKHKSSENLNMEIVGYKTGDGEYRIIQKTRLTGKVIRSLQIDKGVSSRKGTSEVENLFKKKIFPFPKPIELIKRFAMICTTKEDIIIDLFAGSGTTAHAVMQLNAEDGGSRRFIMIQLPELCDENSEAFKAGYKTIAEISKERIRRAGRKIKEESPTTTIDLDIGFRVLKVDSSNMEDVYYTPDEVNQDDLLGHANNIKKDRTSEDLLFQVLVDWGVDLSLPITEESVFGKTVFFVDTNALVACFDLDIDEEFIKQLATHKPLRAVFRDASYSSDSVKINIEQIFKLISPTTDVKSI